MNLNRILFRGLLLSGGGKRGARCLTTSMSLRENQSEKMHIQEIKNTQVASMEYFEDLGKTKREKNKQTFHATLDLYNSRDTRKRGAVEFIKAALKHMKAYGVHRDLETYRKLIDILPKGRYLPENFIQAKFSHFPKQQDCIVDLLCQMEANKVIPDEEMGDLIKNIFGMYSAPIKKFCRMMYWMPKFKNLSPWPLPFDLPENSLALARLAIERITSIDRLTEISVYDSKEISESIDKTWIVSGMSPDQKEIIKNLPKDKALFVEGGFRVWLRDVQITYFILRGEPIPRAPEPQGDPDDVSSGFRMWMYGERDPTAVAKIPNVHEQEDGTIIACCATGTSSKDSLLSWIRFLQRDNPEMENIPVLFTLSSPLGPVIPIDKDSTAVFCRKREGSRFPFSSILSPIQFIPLDLKSGAVRSP